jgi:hypothetical protein
LEIAPEGSLFRIKFCADTSNISDDLKWVFGILQKTSNNTVFKLRNLSQVESKKCLLPWDGDNGLGDMWGLYYRNPTWTEVSNVISGLGVDCNQLLDELISNKDSDESYKHSSSEDGDNLMLTKESVDISQGVLDVSPCEFTMMDSQGRSPCDHKQYQQYVRKGNLLALNYWYPLGFYGYSELYDFVVIYGIKYPLLTGRYDSKIYW